MGDWFRMRSGFEFSSNSMEEAYQAYFSSHVPGLAWLHALWVVFGQLAILGLRLYGPPAVKTVLSAQPYINGTTYPLLVLFICIPWFPHLYAQHWQPIHITVHAITLMNLNSNRRILLRLQASSSPKPLGEPPSSTTFRLFRKFLAENPMLATAAPRALLLPVGLPMEIALGVASLAVQLPYNSEICSLTEWGPERAILMEPFARAAWGLALLLQTTWGLAGEAHWRQNPDGFFSDLPCHTAFALWQVVAVGVCCACAAVRDRCARRGFALQNAALFAEEGLSEDACYPLGCQFVLAEWCGGFLYTSLVPCVLWALVLCLQHVY
eukprot:jgi/Botrbrau1/19189/Bobra.0077s0095.1